MQLYIKKEIDHISQFVSSGITTPRKKIWREIAQLEGEQDFTQGAFIRLFELQNICTGETAYCGYSEIDQKYYEVKR